MRILFPAELFRSAGAGLAMILTAGCATSTEALPPSPTPEHCPAKFSFHYLDSAHGFSLCLPASGKKGEASGYPSGSVLFQGFAVPAGTNLVSKRLVIVPGTDPDMQAATADGHFTAGGVTFSRVKGNEGSAGHRTDYVFYTWTHGGQTLHFGFSFYSSNIADFSPPDQPKEFDLAAQVKFTEEIMKTFRRLP